MTKENEHLLFGGAIATVALFFLWYYKNNSTPPPAASTSDTGQYGGTPLYATSGETAQPVAQAQNEVVPGTQIDMGNSPTYLTYNIPKPLATHLTGAGGISSGKSSCNSSGSCEGCNSCRGLVLQPKTHDQVLRSPKVMEAAIANYHNLQSTGLLQ